MLHIHRIFTWVLLAPAILPFIYIDGLLYPYLTPKTLLLRALGVVAVAIFAYLALSDNPLYWRRLRNPVAWIPGALLLTAYLTSLLGVDFSLSFWSTFERGDGLLTLTVIVSFFYIILLRTEKAFLATLYTVVGWVGSVVALHAVLQWLGAALGFSFPLIPLTGNRIGGTLGNPAFLASYLGISLIITLVAARIARKRSQLLLYAGAALQLLAIFSTATRGTLVALALVGFAALAYISVSSRRFKTHARAALAALFLIAVLFVFFRSSLSQSPITPVARVASISFSDSTVSSRLFLWENLIKEGISRPLTGVGAEHITVLFDKVYDPEKISEQWFDRSHNSFLDYFVQYGIVGFLLYAALVLGTLYVGFRVWKGQDSLYGAGLMGAAAVYAIQNLFVFDTAVVLWLFVALLAASLAARGGEKQLLFTVPHGKRVGMVVGALLLMLLVPVLVQPLRANWYLAQAYAYQVQDPARSVDAMQKGWSLGTYANFEYGYQAYQMYSGQQMVQLGGPERVDTHRNAQLILETNAEHYSYDARTLTYLAHILDVAPEGSEPPREKILAVLEKAKQLSPKRTQPWYLEANVYIQEGDKAAVKADKVKAYTQAAGVLNEYLKIAPSLAEPRYVIATLHLVLGNAAEAKKWADEGLALYRGDANQASRAVKYYIATEDWPHAAQFLVDIVDAYPTDYNSWYDLAKVNYLAGNKEQARQIVDMLRKEKPGFVETDQNFLNALAQ